MTRRTEVTVRVAIGPLARQAAVDAWLAATAATARAPTGVARAVIAEGAFAAPRVPEGTEICLLAAGCVCCIGQLPLRVALTRLLRARRPAHLLLLLASGQHRAKVQALLQDAAFAPILAVTGADDEVAARQRH